MLKPMLTFCLCVAAEPGVPSESKKNEVHKAVLFSSCSIDFYLILLLLSNPQSHKLHIAILASGERL